jgi:hypothetical protein
MKAFRITPEVATEYQKQRDEEELREREALRMKVLEWMGSISGSSPSQAVTRELSRIPRLCHLSHVRLSWSRSSFSNTLPLNPRIRAHRSHPQFNIQFSSNYPYSARARDYLRAVEGRMIAVGARAYEEPRLVVVLLSMTAGPWVRNRVADSTISVLVSTNTALRKGNKDETCSKYVNWVHPRPSGASF